MLTLPPSLDVYITAALFVVGAYGAALYVGLIVWTYRDVRARSRDMLGQVMAVFLVALFTLPGLVVYLLLRPHETLSEAYERGLAEEAILQEAQRETLASLEDFHLSWQSMPRTEERQRVYLLGVPRGLIDAQVRALEEAGVRPYAMDLGPLALIRAIGRQEAIIVNLERDALDLILVVDYLPASMRTSSLEGEDLDERGRFERLVSELSQTVRSYNDSHQDSPVDPDTPVYVVGRLVSTSETVESLKSLIDRPLQQPLPPLPCPAELSVAQYMTNMGLAMKRV